ncbi:hypothetical protein DQP55_02935 [Mycolicibacterium sp. GF69]|nr:hypothetical protein DQP55_02935 [Mycolicibacterium sp. GF69]
MRVAVSAPEADMFDLTAEDALYLSANGSHLYTGGSSGSDKLLERLDLSFPSASWVLGPRFAVRSGRFVGFEYAVERR